MAFTRRPAFYLKRKVSETGFCLRLEVVPTQLSPINRASSCLRRDRRGRRKQNRLLNVAFFK
jgi:hypothetical protein